MEQPETSGPLPAGGSIGRRITLALVGVAVLTVLVVGVLFYGFLGRYVVRRQQVELLTHATTVSAQLEAVGQSSPGMMGPRSRLATFLQVDLQLLPKEGRKLIFQGSDYLAAPALEAESAGRLYEQARALAAGGARAATIHLGGGQPPLLVAAAPASLVQPDDALVVVTLPLRAAGDRGGLLRVLVVAALIGVGLAVVIGAVLGSWLARPLRRLSGAARTMAAGSYAQPITGEYAGEVYELAQSLETMRREVRRSESSLRGFVGSAAHELRTPLTSIEGFSQALLDGTADTEDERRRSAAAIYREAGRLRRLVDALLTLSRFDSREFRPVLARVDAVRLVEEEAERLVEAGLAAPGRISVRGEGPAELVTDADMLRQIVGNLLKNAVQHGGEDPIVASVGVVDRRLQLRVTNGGGLIADEERRHVFERFFRGRGAYRSEGFGLGLPLVREVCEVLGGSVRLSGDGPGTTFEVLLPDRS